MTAPSIPNIEIDMDKECAECHEKGATHNGLCLSCNMKLIVGHEAEVSLFLKARNANKPKDSIVIDCKIGKGISTNWAKGELRIPVEAAYEDTEYEARKLGQLARFEQPVKVLIHRKDELLEDALSIVGIVDACRLDWKIEKLVVVILSVNDTDLIGKLVALGVLANLGVPACVRFYPMQERLL